MENGGKEGADLKIKKIIAAAAVSLMLSASVLAASAYTARAL